MTGGGAALRRERRLYRLVQAGCAAAVFLAWHVSTSTGIVNPILLPSLESSLEEFADLIASGSFWPYLAVTLSELVTAFAMAASLGSVIGYAVSLTRFTVRMFDPLFAGLYSIPVILLFPLYVLFFGIGEGSKIAIGATIAFFPIVLNTIAGFSFVDRTLIAAARSMGASPAQMFWSVMLPAAFPVVLTGLRIGFILAFLSILGTETIASISGLGHQIVAYSEQIEPAKMFAYIFLAIVISFILTAFVSFVERQAQRGRG
jgi:ABC-type nitrate/sulfonate/bicarbonate transport system permease component